VTGFDLFSGYQWWHDFAKDGKITIRGFGDVYSVLDNGTGWSEGDMLCSRFKGNYKGLKICAPIFRNPEGSPAMKNEYLQITDLEIIPFSPVK
jgi:hypothetical protein